MISHKRITPLTGIMMAWKADDTAAHVSQRTQESETDLAFEDLLKQNEYPHPSILIKV